MPTETNDNFKRGLIESIKVAGDMLENMAKDIAGKTEYITHLNISIDFDPEFRSIPEITIHRSHYPDPFQIERLLDIYSGKGESE